MKDPAARRHAFAKKNSLTIGFTAVADFSSQAAREYLAGITQAAEDYGVSLINMTSTVQDALFLDEAVLPQYLTKMQFMRAPLLDGLITWASSLCAYLSEDEIVRRFSALQPLPMTDIGWLDIPGVPSVRADSDHTVQLLATHLVREHGFSRIAFIGVQSMRMHTVLGDCFVREMARLALPCTPHDVCMALSSSAQDIAAQVEQLLARTETLPQAILCADDGIASLVIDALEKRGIAVPDTIAVTGCAQQREGLMASTPVTTVDLACFERGYKAAELLLDRIQYPRAVAFTRSIKPSLVVRQSCGCFEARILQALSPAPSTLPAPPAPGADEKTLRDYVARVARTIFPEESDARQTALVNALMHTIQITPPPPNIIGVVQHGTVTTAGWSGRKNHRAPSGTASAFAGRNARAWHRRYM